VLTFEFDSRQELLCIHGDAEGLHALQEYVRRLIDATPSGKFEHSHLMTPDWGGSELSSEAKDSNAQLIPHVKLYCWKGNLPA
jgi:hypothetical protein